MTQMSNAAVDSRWNDAADKWWERPICAFDTETTGPNPQWARLVTACVSLIDIDGTNVTVKTTNWLADPGGEIPEGASAVHGITTEYAAEHGRPHDEVVGEVADALTRAWANGYIVVAFNASYDLTLIRKLSRDPFDIAGLVVDPYVIDRKFDQYRSGKRKLADMCAHYKVAQEDAHQAEGDALAAARLAYKLLRMPAVPDRRGDLIDWPKLRSLTAEQLMSRQAEWHRERQESFAEYLRKTGKPVDDINFDWPIQS